MQAVYSSNIEGIFSFSLLHQQAVRLENQEELRIRTYGLYCHHLSHTSISQEARSAPRCTDQIYLLRIHDS